MGYCYEHKAQESITCQDIRVARERWPELMTKVVWRGVIPAWSDLGCRGCWGVISPDPKRYAVDAGVGAFHAECYDAIVGVR